MCVSFIGGVALTDVPFFSHMNNISCGNIYSSEITASNDFALK